MNGHFVTNGQTIPITPKAGSSEQGIHVVLPQTLSGKYTAARKDMVSPIPNQWTDPSGKTYTIGWLINFGLIERGKSGYAQGKVSEDYEILVDKQAGKKLFYYDGAIKPFEPADMQEPADQTNKVAARLRLSDPPIGWGS